MSKESKTERERERERERWLDLSPSFLPSLRPCLARHKTYSNKDLQTLTKINKQMRGRCTRSLQLKTTKAIIRRPGHMLLNAERLSSWGFRMGFRLAYIYQARKKNILKAAKIAWPSSPLLSHTCSFEPQRSGPWCSSHRPRGSPAGRKHQRRSSSSAPRLRRIINNNSNEHDRNNRKTVIIVVVIVAITIIRKIKRVIMSVLITRRIQNSDASSCSIGSCSLFRREAGTTKLASAPSLYTQT